MPKSKLFKSKSRLEINLEQSEKAKLEAYCKSQGITVSQWIREQIKGIKK